MNNYIDLQSFAAMDVDMLIAVLKGDVEAVKIAANNPVNKITINRQQYHDNTTIWLLFGDL